MSERKDVAITEYHKLPDEDLKEILAECSKSASSPGTFEYARYKTAYDILQFRQNDKLVNDTRRLTFATWAVAIATIIAILFQSYTFYKDHSSKMQADDNATIKQKNK